MTVVPFPRPFDDETRGPLDFLLEMAKLDATVIWGSDETGTEVGFAVTPEHRCRFDYLLPLGGCPRARSPRWNARYLAIVGDLLSIDDLTMSQRRAAKLRDVIPAALLRELDRRRGR